VDSGLGHRHHVGIDGVSRFSCWTTFLTPIVILAAWGDVHMAREGSYFVRCLFLRPAARRARRARPLPLYVLWEVMSSRWNC